MNGLRNIVEREEDLEEKKGNAVRTQLDFREKEKGFGKKLHDGADQRPSWRMRFLLNGFKIAERTAKEKGT